MALDDDKRDLAKVAQKEPAAFGRIKQMAYDMGMSTEEFILMKDTAATNQQEATETSEIKQSIKELQTEVQQIRFQPQTHPQPTQQQAPPDMFAQMQSMAQFITTIKQMFPQTSLSDVVKQIADLRQAENSIFDTRGDQEAETPTDYALKILADKIIPNLDLKAGSAGSGDLQGNSGLNTASGVQNPDPNIVPNFTNEVVNVNDEQIKEHAKQIPEFIKSGIKSGEITLQQAKDMILPEAQKRQLPVTEQDIEKLYNEVKNEDKKPIQPPADSPAIEEPAAKAPKEKPAAKERKKGNK